MKPTHELKVKDVETNDYAKIGVAWLNPEGHFTIKLSPCTTISYDSLKNKMLTLFPVRTESEWAELRKKKSESGPGSGFPGE